MNFEGKQRNDIVPVETIYTTGDTGARRYGVPAFRPRSSSAQRPSAVDRALNINSNNRNNNSKKVSGGATGRVKKIRRENSKRFKIYKFANL
jgi:hypothetical protein